MDWRLDGSDVTCGSYAFPVRTCVMALTEVSTVVRVTEWWVPGAGGQSLMGAECHFGTMEGSVDGQW
jgi:hypothetical protein